MQQRKKEKAFVDATSYIESLNESSFDPFKSFWCQQRFAALQLEKSTVTSSWNVVSAVINLVQDYFWAKMIKTAMKSSIGSDGLNMFEAKNRLFEFDYQ